MLTHRSIYIVFTGKASGRTLTTLCQGFQPVKATQVPTRPWRPSAEPHFHISSEIPQDSQSMRASFLKWQVDSCERAAVMTLPETRSEQVIKSPSE